MSPDASSPSHPSSYRYDSTRQGQHSYTPSRIRKAPSAPEPAQRESSHQKSSHIWHILQTMDELRRLSPVRLYEYSYHSRRHEHGRQWRESERARAWYRPLCICGAVSILLGLSTRPQLSGLPTLQLPYAATLDAISRLCLSAHHPRKRHLLSWSPDLAMTQSRPRI
jgi:hypothetical protein